MSQEHAEEAGRKEQTAERPVAGAVATPAAGVSGRVLALQRAAGNAAVNRLIGSPRMLARFTGEPAAWVKDPELDALSEAEIVDRAWHALRHLDDLLEHEPDAVARIGCLSWMVLRCHHAWQRKRPTAPLEDSSGDPLAGLHMPGLSYDTTLLSMRATKRAGCAGCLQPVVKKQPPPRRAQTDRHVTLEEDRIGAIRRAPEPALVLDGGGGSTYSAGRHKVAVEIPLGKPVELKYADFSGAIVIEGLLEMPGGKDAKVLWGALAAPTLGTKERGIGFGGQGEAKLYEGKRKEGEGPTVTGIKGTSEAQGGVKHESGKGVKGFAKGGLGFAVEVDWWGYKTEFTIWVVGYDSSSEKDGGFKVLMVEATAPVVEIPEDKPKLVPLSDGRNAKFTGKIALKGTFDPNWSAVAAKVAQLTGRAVATEGAVMASGAGVGIGALAAPVAGAAGIALTIFTFYKSLADVQDVKEVKALADRAVNDFIAGYLSVYGIERKGDRKSPVWAEGARHASIQIDAAAVRIRERIHTDHPDAYGKYSLEYLRGEHIKVYQEAERRDQHVTRKLFAIYERAIRAMVVRKWETDNADRAYFEKLRRHVRTYNGLPDGEDLPVTPQYHLGQW